MAATKSASIRAVSGVKEPLTSTELSSMIPACAKLNVAVLERDADTSAEASALSTGVETEAVVESAVSSLTSARTTFIAAAEAVVL